MTSPPTILDACRDSALFGRWFRDPATWQAWFAFAAALFGLPLAEGDRTIFAQCTGREAPQAGGYREAWLVVGRRGGKSLILAVIAVYLAVFVDWSEHLVPGESGLIMVLAADRRQARVIFRYARALLTRVPLLKPLIARETDELIELTNGLAIEITTASFRVVRGYTIIAALCDEIAFWRSDESSNPDSEIIAALKPAMATVPGAMLLCASSPYARRGVLWDAYRRYFGKENAALVWKADTKTMNPTVPAEVIAEAYESDPARAAAEYGAEFRSDIEDFIAREVVDAVTVPDRHELPPMSGISYTAFVDPSGGSNDSMTLAIAHYDSEIKRAMLDAVRERRPPFSPDDVVGEFADALEAFGVTKIVGDRYAGEWPREQFRVRGIDYEPSEKPKSDLYRDLLPILNSGQAELLDHPRLAAQLCGLERRTARGGRDSIDHPPGAHDDVANVVAGALLLASTRHASIWELIDD